jgi:hypothetical protein
VAVSTEEVVYYQCSTKVVVHIYIIYREFEFIICRHKNNCNYHIGMIYNVYICTRYILVYTVFTHTHTPTLSV